VNVLIIHIVVVRIVQVGGRIRLIEMRHVVVVNSAGIAKACLLNRFRIVAVSTEDVCSRRVVRTTELVGKRAPPEDDAMVGVPLPNPCRNRASPYPQDAANVHDALAGGVDVGPRLH
jgi:hypothetical protein